jgi:hypothetical protein
MGNSGDCECPDGFLRRIWKGQVRVRRQGKQIGAAVDRFLVRYMPVRISDGMGMTMAALRGNLRNMVMSLTGKRMAERSTRKHERCHEDSLQKSLKVKEPLHRL